LESPLYQVVSRFMVVWREFSQPLDSTRSADLFFFYARSPLQFVVRRADGRSHFRRNMFVLFISGPCLTTNLQRPGLSVSFPTRHALAPFFPSGHPRLPPAPAAKTVFPPPPSLLHPRYRPISVCDHSWYGWRSRGDGSGRTHHPHKVCRLAHELCLLVHRPGVQKRTRSLTLPFRKHASCVGLSDAVLGSCSGVPSLLLFVARIVI